MADNTAAELKEKLEEEIHTAEWNDIRPHALRDAVVLVAPGLSLIEASIKVVQDDVDTVKDWLDRKSIEKVTPQHIETWDQTKNKVFSMVILDPYVFIQAQQH